jgi:radical SAM/Cys-rich protein
VSDDSADPHRGLKRARHPLADPAAQRELLEQPLPGGVRFAQALANSGLAALRARGIEVLQVNVGKFCNQSCQHCHVDAGPDRTEVMSAETAELCLAALAGSEIPTLDITGGAPELTPVFRRLVEGARELGRHVIDRCNLTVLLLPSQRGLIEFLARHQVEVIASLPYFQANETDAQRGDGVFARSIEALRRLNAAGYGQPDGALRLNLVYNPVGSFLPPAQAAIEPEFKRELQTRHGVMFNALYTITNMPISRFLEYLQRSGNYERYMQKLIAAYNPLAAAGVMCRSLLSVGWDGTLYDCDFNQMLALPVDHGAAAHIGRFDLESLTSRQVVTGQHCFGCTAGAGSSCGGATV